MYLRWRERKYVRIIVALLLFAACVFAWMYIFSLGSETGRRIILLEAIVCGGVLFVSLFYVFVVGYEKDVGQYIRHSYLASILFSVIGYYLTGLEVISFPEKVQGEYIFYVIQFLLYVLIAAILVVIPVAIMSGIRSMIIGLFDGITG